jgi:NTP pyrophosphatase (non-canonical NTP hydrolase)
VDLERLAVEVEQISQGYARRFGIERDSAWFALKLQEEIGELTQAFLMRAGQARTKGHTAEEIDLRFRGELADVLCHVLLMASHHGVDLVKAVEDKWLVWKPGAVAEPQSLPG